MTQSTLTFMRNSKISKYSHKILMEGLKIINVRFDSSKFRKYLSSRPLMLEKELKKMEYPLLDIIEKHTIPKTPKDTGQLRRSATSRLKLGNGLYEQEISMGAYNERTYYNYAMIQHEHTGYHHSVGQAFYLREGVDESVREVNGLIEKTLAVSLRRNV